jgi:hypothetical protein
MLCDIDITHLWIKKNRLDCKEIHLNIWFFKKLHNPGNILYDDKKENNYTDHCSIFQVCQIFRAVPGIIHDYDNHENNIKTDNKNTQDVKKNCKKIKCTHNETGEDKRTNPDTLNIHIPLLFIVSYKGL